MWIQNFVEETVEERTSTERVGGCVREIVLEGKDWIWL
jgi:hypothetical protein